MTRKLFACGAVFLKCLKNLPQSLTSCATILQAEGGEIKGGGGVD